MAASIRVRIVDVRLDNNPLHKFGDPFWLLISKAQCPFISDVTKRILSTYDDISIFQKVSIENALCQCQLWLDGCRLPNSERTEILRDNDSIVVSISQNAVLKDNGDTSRFLQDKERISTNNDSLKRKRSESTDHENLSNIPDVESEQSCHDTTHEIKKKRQEDGDEDSDYSQVSVGTETYQTKKDDEHNVLTSRLTEEDIEKSDFVSHKGSSDNINLEFENKTDSDLLCKRKKKKKDKKDADGKKRHLKKKKDKKDADGKKRRLKKKKDKKDADEKKRHLKSNISLENIAVPLALTEEDHISTPAEAFRRDLMDVSAIEEQRRKLLDKLDSYIESGKLSCDTEVPTNDLNVSPVDKDEFIADTSMASIKRKRRRRKKKPKGKEGLKSVVRVEDKPRSSILNLPWNMQPQNNKVTFSSDSDDSVVDKTDEEGKQNDVTKADEKVNNDDDGRRETSNFQRSTDNIRDYAKDDEKERLGPKSTSKKYKDLTPTCRKYLMRSTVGILDSLRSNSSNTSTSPNFPVIIKGSSESVSPLSAKSKSSISSNDKTQSDDSPVTSRAVDSAVIKSNSDLIDEFKSPSRKHSCDQASNYSHGHQTYATEKLNVPSSSPSYDCEAKFIELLQRRKLSNTSCNVTRSQNGVTICSRNKSPRLNPQHQSNGFADPTRDMLTNVSTVKQKPTDGGENNTQVTVNGTYGNSELQKVEVTPLDVESCQALSGNPCSGDILAYKTLEMSEDYTPVVSDFKTGKVLSFAGGFVTLEIFGGAGLRKPKGKFELVYDDEEQTTESPDTDIDEQVSVELASMMDTRLVQRYTDTTTKP